MIISKTLGFLAEMVYSFIAYILVSSMAIMSKGFQYVLSIGFDLEKVFGFDYKIFLPPVTTIAALFLILLIFLDIAKSFSMVEDTEIKSMPEYMKRIVIAFSLMIILPIVVTIFQLVSEYFIGFCNQTLNHLMSSKMGVDINKDAWGILQDSAKDIYKKSSELSGTTEVEAGRILVLLIYLTGFLVGFALIGISLMKRYVELLLALIFVPFIATSVYSNYDKLSAWLSRVAQIFAGYALNIFLVYVMLGLAVAVLKSTAEQLVVSLFLLIAVISVAISGSQAIKEYIVSTNTGGQASSMARNAEMLMRLKK